MRVKRLEIQGFKSFKDKTVIHFDHGITGIVGPNGCGKSNIVDAFFWVMGEQSYKHMRGNCSEDLIFNGSSRHAPLGVAEATLVLETDVVDTENAPAGASVADLPVHLRSKEVSVTRRLYRSGEGEYFINGVQARLKDIHELFMDTGVGAKGYSVIEQGQIGKIVNAKPEERRLLVEEAAGIAKYKARKKESLRKLEATQGNLSRLTDIIQEIERNLASLERQAQKARQYKRYKDELLDKEMTWGRRKSQVLRQRLELAQTQRSVLEQELAGLRAELGTTENSVETDRIAQLTATKLAEELQAAVQARSDELTRERAALELSRRRQTDLESQRRALSNEREELSSSIAEEAEKVLAREEAVTEAQAGLEETTGAVGAAEGATQELREQNDAERHRLEGFRRELVAGVTRASDLSQRDATLAARIESARERVARLEEDTFELEQKLGVIREELEAAQEATANAKGNRDALQEKRGSLMNALHSSEQELKNGERERDQSLRSLTQLKSRLAGLEELSAAHEGLAGGPKAALDWAKNLGISDRLQALTEAFEVEPGRETALQGWLEGRLEGLVAREGVTALEAVDAVAEARCGRIAIHVAPPWRSTLTTVTLSFEEISTRLRGMGFTVLGRLDQWVRVSASLAQDAQETARALTTHVCVVESIAPLRTLLEAGRLSELRGWSLVSQDGTALGDDGVLRGGVQENDRTTAMLRRRHVIQELQSQVLTEETRHVERETTVETARRAVDEAREATQTIQAELQDAEIRVATLERDVHQASRSFREAESRVGEIRKETATAIEEAARAESERAGIADQLAEIAARRLELETRIRQSETALPELDARLRERESERQTLRVREAELRERVTSLRRELDAARALVSDRQRRLAEIERTLDRATQEHAQFTGGDTGLEQRIETLVRELDQRRGQLSEVKDEIERSSAKVTGALDRIKELHQRGDQMSASCNQLAIECEKMSSELSHLVQNLEEKYGQGCLERPVTSPIQEEMTAPVVTAEMSAEEEQLLGEEVERLRERIRRLGEVNVMAIEEFEELQKRFDYLTKEKNDLEQSISNLQEAIEHINKTSEERFKRAFEAIADRFSRLFPIIFGGGYAQLSLVFPEGSTDVLEAGVDILAQPPGKKVVNITLLSGGEKALTAVSLIFAIFMVKPSPFCVLDEVDAPLDDANIGKFNALLREMSAKSQFILITHNKKTMELNDTLYGVTMEEPGVSKMVSIELH